MEMRRIIACVAALGAATALQGCVAAVPLAAAGLMGGSSTINPSDELGDAPRVASPAPSNDPSVEVALSEAASVAAPEPAPQPAVSAQDRTPSISEPEPAPDPIRLAEVETPATSTPGTGTGQVAEIASAPESPPAVEIAPPAPVAPAPAPAPATIPEPAASADATRAPAILDTSPGVGAGFAADSGRAETPISNIERGNLAANEEAPIAYAATATAPAAAPAPAPATPAARPAPPAAAPASTPVAQAPAPSGPAANVAPTIPSQPPVSASTAPTASLAATSGNSITSLISYANQRKFEFAPGQTRTSAMLADRISLEPVRANCGGVRPTVLIDLDPEGELFTPSTSARPPSGLGGGLAQLRAAGVDVVWISGNPASQADLIRTALDRSGLDLSGRDQLLLMRSDDDRKQTRREELAQTACLVAIAGDTRSDFDELYDYLLNPSEAATLEPLIGDGWFLIPQPLLSEEGE